MKFHLALVLAPFLVQCGSSSGSNGTSSDAGADAGDAGDAGEDATSSGSSGGSGSSSGVDSGSGSSGSGSGGGDGAVQMSCKTATTPVHLTYTVTQVGTSNVITHSFDVDAIWGPQTPMPAPWWRVYAHGSTCVFRPIAEIRLGSTVGDAGADADAGDDAGTDTDGGMALPTTAATWASGGNEYPQSASDGTVWLSEDVDVSSGSGNFWSSSKGGSISGMPVGTDCYELDFLGLSFEPDPRIRNPSVNLAMGTFTASGTARIGSGCQ